MTVACHLRKTFTLPAASITLLWLVSALTWGGEAEIAGATYPRVGTIAADHVAIAASTVGMNGKHPSHHELVEQMRRNLAAYYEDIPLCVQLCTETIQAAQKSDDATILAIARMQRSAARLRWMGFEECQSDFELAIRVGFNSHDPELVLLFQIARTTVEHAVYSETDCLNQLRQATYAAANAAHSDVLFAAKFELAVRSMKTQPETQSAQYVPSRMTTMHTTAISLETHQNQLLSVLRQPTTTGDTRLADELNRGDFLRTEILSLPQMLNECGAPRRHQFESGLLAATMLQRNGQLKVSLETLTAARHIMLSAQDFAAVTLADIRIGTVQQSLGQEASARDALISAAEHIQLITAPSTLTQLSSTGSQISFFSKPLPRHEASLSIAVQRRFLDIQKQARWMRDIVRDSKALQMQALLTETSSRGFVLETERDAAMQAREFYLRLTGIGLVGCIGLALFLLRERRLLRKLNSQLCEEILTREKAAEERERLDLHVAQSARLESLGDLAGGIAHDFNNLLVGVLGNAELLRYSEDISERAAEYLNGITTAAETAADLSRKMLAYAGKQPGQKTNVELNQLVQRMLPLFRSGAGVQHDVEFFPSTHPVYTEADDGQLEQILLNLVTNAAHAMSNRIGTIQIRVGVEMVKEISVDPSLFGNRREDGDFAWFEIADCGRGIPGTHLTRIFEPFFTTKDHPRSHGFGLAIVYGHVNRHDGLIRLKSTRDVGTTFRILLPRLSEFHAGGLRVGGDLSSRALPTRVTAVIVDDQLQVLQFVERLFQANHWSAHCFLTASEALEFLSEEHAIDCLLIDLMMPCVDGASMVEELEHRGLKIPVVLMSGFSQTNMNDLLRFQCVSSLLEKPFRSGELVKAISAAVSRSPDPVTRTLERDH
ncbi:MAG: ATP-binding protein [Planctomycetaceae bacterium]